jgi:hypothetical protein
MIKIRFSFPAILFLKFDKDGYLVYMGIFIPVIIGIFGLPRFALYRGLSIKNPLGASLGMVDYINNHKIKVHPYILKAQNKWMIDLFRSKDGSN